MNARVRQRKYMAIDTIREQNFQGTNIPRNESFIELSFPGAKRPGSERAREQIGQRAKGPGSKSSRERIGPGAKRLGTVHAGLLRTAALLITYITCLTTHHNDAAWVSSRAMLFTNRVFFDTLPHKLNIKLGAP